MEWLFYAWPNEVAVILVFSGFVWLVLDPQRMLARVDLLFVLPLMFLLTQAVTAPTSICRQTTIDTLMLFATCALLFYVGAWYVRDGAATARIFGGLTLATLFVCMMALEQHFGGLAESRKQASMYLDSSKVPKDLLLRMTSNRVFGSFVYPNALAGFLVISFMPTLTWIGVRARGWAPWVKMDGPRVCGRGDGFLSGTHRVTRRLCGVCGNGVDSVVVQYFQAGSTVSCRGAGPYLGACRGFCSRRAARVSTPWRAKLGGADRLLAWRHCHRQGSSMGRYRTRHVRFDLSEIQDSADGRGSGRPQ